MKSLPLTSSTWHDGWCLNVDVAEPQPNMLKFNVDISKIAFCGHEVNIFYPLTQKAAIGKICHAINLHITHKKMLKNYFFYSQLLHS
jgi:hypothetical protein